MIYIQKAEGLQQVSPSLTKEKIIAALGFTPADNATFFEDESGSLLVADNAGYVVARIDKDGIHTTRVMASAISLGDMDLDAKLKALQNAIDNIDVGDIDLSNYYTKSEVDNAIANAEVDLTGVATEKYVDDAVAGIKHPTVDLSAYDSHITDEEIHVTAENKETWDNKSDFDGDYNKLSNAPQILNDNQDEMVVCDSKGNVLFRATADGLNVAAIYVNGERINAGPSTFYIRMDDDVAPTPHTFLPGMNFKDWVNSDYCTVDIAYSTNSNYYRFTNAGLAILEDFNDYKTGANHTTSIYEGKIFYCRADDIEPVAN